MDRREMLKGAAMLPSMLAVYPLEEFVADFSRENADGSHPAIPKPYDPVSVLEAMRERGLWFEFSPGDEAGWMVVFTGSFYSSFMNSAQRPDFRSAVLWLHKQAAAVDAEFAKAWPVPE